MNKIKIIHSDVYGGTPVEDKKTLIYNRAKELFCSNGFKDTNILVITKKPEWQLGLFIIIIPLKKNCLWISSWRKTRNLRNLVFSHWICIKIQ